MALCGRSFCSQRAVTAESVEVPPSEDLFKNLPGEFVDVGITLAPGIEEDPVPNANFDTDITKIYIIAAIYLACSIAAALLVAFFVDPLSRFDTTDERRDRTQSSGLQLLVATFRHMKKKEQILVIPITFWSGIEQGFFGADFTAGLVTCAYGVHTVGRVLILFGVCNAAASIGFSFIIKKDGRLPIFVLGACINALVIIVMLAWTPTQSTLGVVYFLAALWGIGDAIWQTQIN